MASITDAFDIRSIFKDDALNSAKVRDVTVIDKDWVSARYMVPKSDLPKDVQEILHKSGASIKFTNTSLGGSVFINPRPQFNPLTDPRMPGILDNGIPPDLSPTDRNQGMGDGYSRLIDDNQQVVFMEFGLPRFNSLIDFMFRAVDYADSVLANTGRPSRFYEYGKVIGRGLTLLAFPILTITILLGKKIAKIAAGESVLKYYYFDSKMDMYWGTVNTLVTQLATEQGLLSPVFMDNNANNPPDATQVGTVMELNQADIDNINKIVNGIISPNTNYIDVFAIATRSQKMALAQKSYIAKMVSEGKTETADGVDINAYGKPSLTDNIDNGITFGSYLKKIHGTYKGPLHGDEPVKTPPKTTNANTNVNIENSRFTPDPNTDTYMVKTSNEEKSIMDSLVESFDSSLRQGGAYAVFAVDYVGSTSESFSNSVTNIQLGDTIKQLSNKSRSLSYDLARGNIFGDTFVQDAINGITDLAKGVISSVTFGLDSVVQSMTGNAYVDVPKRWDDSSISFKQHTYTIQARSPYNTYLSQLQNMYLPACMILAGVMPLATGKSSYTSPYLCTLFNRGIENVKLGMITSVTIERGTSNLAYDRKWGALALDISFTVTDFSNLVAAPVNSSVYGDNFTAKYEDDTPLGNYISLLGARDVLTSKYSSKRTAMRISNELMDIEQTFNADRYGLLIGNILSQSPLGGLASVRALPNNLSK